MTTFILDGIIYIRAGEDNNIALECPGKNEGPPPPHQGAFLAARNLGT